jgi:lysophospholipase L1-like esterase
MLESSAMTSFHDAFKYWNMGKRGICLVFLGDSVTQGYTAYQVLEHRRVFHQRVKEALNEIYPQVVVNVINAGVGGDRAPQSLDRLERDVFPHQPDGLVIAFGLNDANQGEAGLARFVAALRNIVEQARERGVKWVVLVSPPFMATKDNPNIAPANRSHLEKILNTQNSGVLAKYAQAIRELGAELNVPVADVHAHWQGLAQQGVDTNAMLSNGLNHPTPEAHQIHADLVLEALRSL